MASKTGQDAASIEQIEELLDAVDSTLDRLKTLYEQYFLGIQKQAPSFIHNDVERKLRDLTQINIRNTGLRYRLATLQQKFGSYNSYWRRTLRQIEGGTYARNLAKIGREAARTGSEIPDEILAAMPKRMREQVLRDRDQALAIAKRRQGETGDAASLDDEPVQITDAPKRDIKTASGAHVLSEEDGDIDFNALFSAFDDDAPKTIERAKKASTMPPVGRPQVPRMPTPNDPLTPRAAVAATPPSGMKNAEAGEPADHTTNVLPVMPRPATPAGGATVARPTPAGSSGVPRPVGQQPSSPLAASPVARPTPAGSSAVPPAPPGVARPTPAGSSAVPPAPPGAARPTPAGASGVPRPVGQQPSAPTMGIPRAVNQSPSSPVYATGPVPAPMPATESSAIPRPVGQQPSTPASGVPRVVGQQPSAPTSAIPRPVGQQPSTPTSAIPRPVGQQPSTPTSAIPRPVGQQPSTPTSAIPRPVGQQPSTPTGAIPRPVGQPSTPIPAPPSRLTPPAGIPRPQTGASPTFTQPIPRPMPGDGSRPTPRPQTEPSPLITQPIPRPAAPSQQSRPIPVMPGAASQTGPVPVESMSGPFPREQSTQAIPKPGTTQAMPKPGTTQAMPKPGTTQAMPKPGQTQSLPKAPLKPPPGMTDADVNALHAKYVKAKEMIGEKVDAGSRDKLLKTITQTAPKIMEQYKASGVDFSVVVKDNQVIIKAKPKT